MNLHTTDPEVASAIDREYRRQTETLEMIASENFVSPMVLEAQGCLMTNKYAEGYPGKRYYGGCGNVDTVEHLAIERAKKLFDAEHANVQAHSGSQANMAVYFALLEMGSTMLGMNLAHGGHLTHGSPVNFSGKFFKVIPYGVHPKTETIDYDELDKLADEHKPRLIIAGGSAYPRIIDFKRIRETANRVGAIFMVDMAHFAGLVAGGIHPNPVHYADVITSTTHKTLRGPRAGFILCKELYAKAIDKTIFPGIQGGPLMHVIAAKAVAFGEALTPRFKTYVEQIVKNAKTLGNALVEKKLRLVSGGTDTHLLLVDLTPLGITGKIAETALEEAGITVNKNMIPFDKEKPTVTSGIRIGTPALTTRGMNEDDMRQIADWIFTALKNHDNPQVKSAIRAEVKSFCAKYPLHKGVFE